MTPVHFMLKFFLSKVALNPTRRLIDYPIPHLKASQLQNCQVFQLKSFNDGEYFELLSENREHPQIVGAFGTGNECEMGTMEEKSKSSQTVVDVFNFVDI